MRNDDGGMRSSPTNGDYGKILMKNGDGGMNPSPKNDDGEKSCAAKMSDLKRLFQHFHLLMELRLFFLP